MRKRYLDLFLRIFLIILLFSKSFTKTEQKGDSCLIKEIKEALREREKKEAVFVEEKKEGIHELIIRISKKYNVDPALIKAIIMVESRFDPHAVSYRGAKGLMQLMPVTLKEMGAKDPFDPENNIEAGVRYFKKLLILFNNNIELALAAYNAGIRKVKLYGGIPPFRSTRQYIRKVMRYYEIYRREMKDEDTFCKWKPS